MSKIFLLSLFLALSMFCFSQDTTRLATDRPDQTDGVNMLKKGELQLETELYYNTFDTGRAAIISSTLLRYGVLKNFELRLLVEEGRERDKFIQNTTQGVYPLALSAKVALLKDHAVLPDIAFITYVKMPFTRQSSSDVYWSPAFILALEQDLNKFTVASNVVLKQAAFSTSMNWQASAEAKYRVGPKIEVFAEYFAQYEHYESPVHNIDGGVLIYISNNIMLHAVYGSTVFTKDSNHFINTGFAFRFK